MLLIYFSFSSIPRGVKKFTVSELSKCSITITLDDRNLQRGTLKMLSMNNDFKYKCLVTQTTIELVFCFLWYQR